MSKYNQRLLSDIRNQPDYKYIDLNFRNFDTTDVVTKRPLVFTDTRDSPIVANAKDYKMSIVRFQIDSYLALPILFFEIVRNQPDVNLGVYTVTLEYDDGVGGITTTTPVNLIWIPQNVDDPIPSAPTSNNLGLQDINEYYWCYTYEYFIELVNTALSTAMTQLQGLVAPILDTVEPPFLTWEADSAKARLYARVSHFNTNVFPQVKIYFNRTLFALFNSFNSRNFSASTTNGRQHQIIVDNYFGAREVTIPDFGIDQLIYVDQDVSTVANWSPVSSVVWTSSTLPVEPNDLSVPTVFVDGKQINTTNTYSLASNIITDMSTDEFGYHPNLLYTPSAQYRYVTLFNDQPIRDIDISVFWRDYLGILRPFLVPPSANCSVKILFEKIKK